MDKELLQQFWSVLESPKKVSLDAYYDAIPWVTKRKVTTHLEVVNDVSYQFKIVRTGNHYDVKIDPKWGDVTINYGWIIALIVLDEFTGEFTCLSDGVLDIQGGSYDYNRHLDFALALILPDEVITTLAGRMPISEIAKLFDLDRSSVTRRFKKMDMATWTNLNVVRAKPTLNMAKWIRVCIGVMLTIIIMMIIAWFFDSQWAICVLTWCEVGMLFMLFREKTFPVFGLIWRKVKGKYRKIKGWFYE